MGFWVIGLEKRHSVDYMILEYYIWKIKIKISIFATLHTSSIHVLRSSEQRQ